MSHKDRFFLPIASTVAAFLFMSGAASAQSTGGSLQAPAAAGNRASIANPVPPTGPSVSVMPLADLEQFENAEQRLGSSVMTGVPGVSDGQPAVSGTRAYGTSTAPYTTSRVAVTVLGTSTSAINTPVTSYPYRATGRLYFKVGTGTAKCSASLIKKGVLLTAAHCVFNYGKKTTGWYNSFVFCPANTTTTSGPYGCYTATAPRILTPYYNGNDVCTQAGVVCNNDIATLVLVPKSGVYAGNVVGWYNYSWNGYSYRNSTFLGNAKTVQITQLGYPGAFDSGAQMQRTDAVGWYYASGNLKNTQMGSAQTAGSSGGPWLANFGTVPSVSSSASRGTHTVQTIVGITSYGSTTIGYNRQGSSYLGQNSAYTGTYGTYGAGNIGLLVRDTCTANPSYC